MAEVSTICRSFYASCRATRRGNKEILRIPNVIVRTLTDNITVGKKRNLRFVIKPASILQSSFEHVLWMDADNIAVRDPEYLFDLPHYTHSTAMFWPDLWSTPGTNPIWKILNISCRAEDYEQESGQILINKRLSWRALNLALHLNLDPIVSKVIHGDKDTYRLSWKILGTPFYFVRKFLAIAGFDYVKTASKGNRSRTLGFCGHTMVQHDPFGEILFLHANLAKEYGQIVLPIEKAHSQLKTYSNLWRIYRRYANSAPYFRPLLFRVGMMWCTGFTTDPNEHMPSLFDDDFHNQVSVNTTAKYLSYLNGSIIQSNKSATITVVERKWTIK